MVYTEAGTSLDRHLLWESSCSPPTITTFCVKPSERPGLGGTPGWQCSRKASHYDSEVIFSVSKARTRSPSHLSLPPREQSVVRLTSGQSRKHEGLWVATGGLGLGWQRVSLPPLMMWEPQGGKDTRDGSIHFRAGSWHSWGAESSFL